MRDFAERRTVLRSGVAACTAGLAGCLNRLRGGDDDGDSSPPRNRSDGNETEPDDSSEPEPDPVEAWPSFQNDARNSGYAEGRAPSEELEVAWTFEAREDVGTNEDEVIRGGPVISEDGIVYVGAEDRAFYALNIEEGELLWSIEIPQQMNRSPLIYEDLVIISIDDAVKAYDRHSGNPRWKFPIREGRTPTPPVEENGILVVGTGEKRIYGINAAEGTEIWRNDKDQNLRSPAAIYDGDAYVTDWTNKVHVVDLSTGATQYTTSIDSEQLTGATVVDDRLYIGDNSGVFYAKDVTGNGNALWTYSDGDVAIPHSPVVSSSTIFLWDENVGIVALNKDGSTVWTFENNSLFFSVPVMADNSLYVGGSNGELYAIEATQGEILDSIRVEGLIYSPSIAHDKIVFGTDRGKVYAVQGEY